VTKEYIYHLKLIKIEMSKDTDVVLKIGTVVPFTSSHSSQKLCAIEVGTPDGGTQTLTRELSVISRHLGKDPKMYAAIAPLGITFSRRSPEHLIRKDTPNEVIDLVIAHLKKCAYMFDKNNPEQYSTATGEVVGKKAGVALYWFEDVRVSKQKVFTDRKETLKIGNYIMDQLSGNPAKLREALYHIGQRPTEDMDALDLENTLIELASKEFSPERKSFVETYVDKVSSDRDLEVLGSLRRAIAFGVVTKSADDVYTIGSDRLGFGEKEALGYLKSHNPVYEFLLSSLASKSTFSEDKERGIEVAATKNSSVKEVAEQAALWEALKEMFKANLGVKNPGLLISKLKTIEDAIAKYNEKLKESELEAPKLTLKSLTERVAESV